MTFSFNNMGNLGHLGNQMFQYSVLEGLSKRHNRPFMIPPKSWFGAHYRYKLRSNLHEAFNLKCQFGVSDYPTIKAKHFHFDEDFFENPPQENVNLYGFFQTEKYFGTAQEEIKKVFTFKDEYMETAHEMRNQLSGDLLSLHIRRTDYVGHTGHEAFGIEYYEKALKLVPDDIKCIIFTDDPKWAMDQELFPDGKFLVSMVDCPYTDMALMTLCDYHIIANSTFSWWGAWLAKNTKKVIAPSPWFGPAKNHDTSDVYCKNWSIVK